MRAFLACLALRLRSRSAVRMDLARARARVRGERERNMSRESGACVCYGCVKKTQGRRKKKIGTSLAHTVMLSRGIEKGKKIVKKHFWEILIGTIILGLVVGFVVDNQTTLKIIEYALIAFIVGIFVTAFVVLTWLWFSPNIKKRSEAFTG